MTEFVAVHLLILREAVCYGCGWGSEPYDNPADAEAAAEAHRCPESTR